MESIYYVMAWACHRRCKHCYEDRFRPYVRGDLAKVVNEAKANFPRIIDNLPERLTYLDREHPGPDGKPIELPGRIVLSGGESLLDSIRDEVTYPVIARLRDRYAGQGGVKIVVQTTGDLLTDEIIDRLLALDVFMISVASIDDFHVGLEGPEKQKRFIDGLTTMFERHGIRESSVSSSVGRKWFEEEGPVFSFFGAKPDTWIGKLWPRGRAWKNGLSTATMADNFCNRWSGGLGFLDHEYNGSEVSIEPNGDLFPCCVKTSVPIGNLLDEGLIEILDSLKNEPAYQAISAGQPQLMGLEHDWSVEKFVEASSTVTPVGSDYANLCIGCDKFHEQVLRPILASARARRLAARGVREAGAMASALLP